MRDTAVAKLIMDGGDQAVCLPEGFHLPGTEVRVRRVGRGVLLEPIAERFDMAAWWAKLDEYLDTPFMPEGREQPATPADRRKDFGE